MSLRTATHRFWHTPLQGKAGVKGRDGPGRKGVWKRLYRELKSHLQNESTEERTNQRMSTLLLCKEGTNGGNYRGVWIHSSTSSELEINALNKQADK